MLQQPIHPGQFDAAVYARQLSRSLTLDKQFALVRSLIDLMSVEADGYGVDICSEISKADDALFEAKELWAAGGVS